MKVPTVDEVFEMMVDMFGEEYVHEYEKNLIHVWQGKHLALRARKKNTGWVIQFSAALPPFAAAQAAAFFTLYMDFVVGVPFLRLDDGSIVDGEAAMVYASKDIQKYWFGRDLGEIMPMEMKESDEGGVLFTSRGRRPLN